jgi:hypothetical protein
MSFKPQDLQKRTIRNQQFEETGMYVNGQPNPAYFRWLRGTVGIGLGTVVLTFAFAGTDSKLALVSLFGGPAVGIFLMLKYGKAFYSLGSNRLVHRSEQPVRFWIAVLLAAFVPVMVAVILIGSLF